MGNNPSPLAVMALLVGAPVATVFVMLLILAVA